MVPGTLAGALSAWGSAIGEEHVVTDAASLDSASTGTYYTGNRVSAILRPASAAEVADCLRIASAERIPVYPISAGRNWGYGSRMPSTDGCVLLDLGRMNRIVDFSEELGYVTVEPGVTQAQLQEFLTSQGSRLWMDSTGASPLCSILGNTVERGFGHTPYGDHFANSCGLQVVLGTGAIIETGFARFRGAHAAPTYRWGVGPTLDGLFSQSNFGVVTRMTVWLMPAPEYFQAYYFRCERSDELPGLINALRPLRMNGTIRSASHIANDYKVISALEQYPWDRMGGKTPLAGPLMAELRKELRIGAWNGSGALYGTKAQVAEARRLLRRALRGSAQRLEFLDDRKLAMASRFAGVYEKISGWNLKRTLAVLRPVYGLMKGIPTDQPLGSTYWRKRRPPPREDMNPDRDGCGLLWCSPVAPNDGAHAARITDLATGIVLSHGLEPVISLTVLTERTISCIISLGFDREMPGEDDRALACYRDLLEKLGEAGYFPYRLCAGEMSSMEDGSLYPEILRQFKQTLDPAKIISPGRYLANQ
jgi:4-cresol dehydrogenase (hydroxylating)